jgi:hypothetical protein
LPGGLRAHFIDHALQLSGPPLLMLWTYGPATALNIAVNLDVVATLRHFRSGLDGAVVS